MNNRLRSLALVAFSSGALAKLRINSFCDGGISIRVANGDDPCEQGETGCLNSPGYKAWRLESGGSWEWDWTTLTDAVSVKMQLDGDGEAQVLQYEYSLNDGGMFWDLSDLDGNGGGLLGSRLAQQDLVMSVSGNTQPSDTCNSWKCLGERVCPHLYNNPNDVNTSNCPKNTGDMTLDLCVSKEMFGQVEEPVENVYGPMRGNEQNNVAGVYNTEAQPHPDERVDTTNPPPATTTVPATTNGQTTNGQTTNDQTTNNQNNQNNQNNWNGDNGPWNGEGWQRPGQKVRRRGHLPHRQRIAAALLHRHSG